MLPAVLALEQTSVRKSELRNQSFKVLTKISQVDLFLTLVSSSHWKHRLVGQLPSDSLGAGCASEDSSSQQRLKLPRPPHLNPTTLAEARFLKGIPGDFAKCTERKARGIGT